LFRVADLNTINNREVTVEHMMLTLQTKELSQRRSIHWLSTSHAHTEFSQLADTLPSISPSKMKLIRVNSMFTMLLRLAILRRTSDLTGTLRTQPIGEDHSLHLPIAEPPSSYQQDLTMLKEFPMLTSKLAIAQ
jgi:hypothetical protein